LDAPVAADDGGELSVAGLGDGERGDRVARLTRPSPLHPAHVWVRPVDNELIGTDVTAAANRR
jgi:hypothetical protein